MNSVYGKSVFVLLTKNTKQDFLAQFKPIKLNFRTSHFPGGIMDSIILLWLYVMCLRNTVERLQNCWIVLNIWCCLQIERQWGKVSNSYYTIFFYLYKNNNNKFSCIFYNHKFLILCTSIIFKTLFWELNM